jgi:alkanesulfonate monooxygenase SsuD/methylene tetrahydromethanopterin reductase-like flavin-dependent oxidoreductase (luciferase family)
MEFELFSECQTASRDYYKRYWEILREVELADELGWDSYGMSEQHFTPEYFTSSAPEVFFAAVAMRTKRIRLRHGIALLPYRVNHPLKVAERTALLDILSNGRIELGTGRGNTLRMLRAFEVPLDETREQWDEALSTIPKMWTEDPFAWEGKFFHIPPTHVVPKPVQKPHPPLWTAGTGPDMYEIAGRKGIGIMCFTYAPPEETAKYIEIYRNAIKSAEPVGSYVFNKTSILSLCFCAETTAEAKRIAREPIMNFVSEAARISSELARTKVKSYEYMGAVDLDETKKKVEDFDYLCDSGLIVVGDPPTCLEKLRMYQQADADGVILRMDGMPHEQIMNSIRLLSEHVIPHFRALRRSRTKPAG